MGDGFPKGWRTVRLAEVADLFNGKAAGSGGTWLRVFKTRHVYDGYLRLSEPTFAPDEKAARVPTTTFLRSGDTLTPNMAHGTIGRVAFVREADERWTVDGQIMVIRPKDESVLGRYLFDWMSRQQSKSQLVAMEKGGAFDQLRGQTHIYRGDVGGIMVRVPPLGEQRKIAAILSSVDDAIEATQAVIDQLQVVKKAMMAELLTRGLPGRHTRFKMTEIGEVPEEWEVVPFEEVLAPGDSLSYGILQPGHDDPNGIPMLRTVDLDEDGGRSATSVLRVSATVEAPYERTRLRGGEVLLSVMGTVGRTVVVPPEWRGWNVNRALSVIRLNARVSPAFMSFWLRSPLTQGRFAVEQIGSAQKRINLGDLRRMLVPLPSTDDQLAICGVLLSLDERLACDHHALAAIRRVKSSLMSVLLTGEVRVKPDEEAA